MESQTGQANINTTSMLEANGPQRVPPTGPDHIHLKLQEPSQLFLPASTTPPRNPLAAWCFSGLEVANSDFRVAVCDVSPHLDHRMPLWSQGPALHLSGQGLSCHGRTDSCGSLPGCGGCFHSQVVQGDWCTGAAQPPWPGPDCKPFAR